VLSCICVSGVSTLSVLSLSDSVVFVCFPFNFYDIYFDLIVTRPAPLVEQELLTLPEHLSSPPVFSAVRVTRSLVLCVCLSFCPFSVAHCVVCSWIYGL
jgi:hypothetical protein